MYFYVLFTYLFAIGILAAKEEWSMNDFWMTLFSPFVFPIILGIKFFNWDETKNK
jgi:hypothetical protein